MVDVRFQTAFSKYKVRHQPNGGSTAWCEIPCLELSIKKTVNDRTGTFSLKYPNPLGIYNTTFTNYDYMELWMANLSTETMYRTLSGQLNNVKNNTKGMVLELDGRSLSGLMTDIKINDAYEDMRIDYILCDPTFGLIPLYLDDRISTWNAFTQDYDRFDSWEDSRWGAIPAYCSISNSTMVMAGDAGSTRTLTGSDEYAYKTIEFYLKISAAANDIRFGFTNAGRTNYVQFELTSGGGNAENSDGTETTTAISGLPTVTDYNHYRIEWGGNDVRYYINGVLKITNTTHIPSASLKPFFEIATNGSTITCDWMKVSNLMDLIDRCVMKDEIFADVAKKLCDIGDEEDSYSFWIDDDWDFNAIVTQSTDSGYDFGYYSDTYTENSQQILAMGYGLEGKELFNQVTITGGDELITVDSPDWTESGKGDGTTVSFNLGYKAKKPFKALQVNSVAKTEDTDYSVIYGKEVGIVKFSTAPGSGLTINYRYDKLMPIKVTATNQDSIDLYGVTRQYQKNDESILTREQANKVAQALLYFFRTPTNVISITIPCNPQLQIGQTVSIDAPTMGITDTNYEIAEMTHEMGAGKFNTKLALVNAEINTLGVTIKEIWQQLKDLKSRGETTETVHQEQEMADTLTNTTELAYYTEWVCDSFIIGHDENSKLGQGTVLEEWESGVTNWTSSDFTVTNDAVTYRVGAKSCKCVYSGAAAKTLNGVANFGDISTYTGASSGKPAKGTVGVWMYIANAGDISSIVMKLGSDSSNYTECTGSVCSSAYGNEQRDGWNLYLFDIDNGSETGTPVWTACDYTVFIITTVSGTELYLDYFTISMSNTISLCGLGAKRIMQEDSYTVIG